jgi:hypothetical protein
MPIVVDQLLDTVREVLELYGRQNFRCASNENAPRSMAESILTTKTLSPPRHKGTKKI